MCDISLVNLPVDDYRKIPIKNFLPKGFFLGGGGGASIILTHKHLKHRQNEGEHVGLIIGYNRSA